MSWQTLVLYACGFAGVALLYVFLAMDLVPGLREERLGRGRMVPPDLFDWKTDSTSPEATSAQARGLVRESRLVRRPSGLLRRPAYVRQTRLRDPATEDIVHIEADQRLRRAELLQLSVEAPAERS